MTRSEELKRHIVMMEALLSGAISAVDFDEKYRALADVEHEPWDDELYDILQGAWSDAEVFTTVEPVDLATELDEPSLKTSIAKRLSDLRAYMVGHGIG